MKKQTLELYRNVFFNLLMSMCVLSGFISHDTLEASPYNKAYLDPGTGSMIISAIVGVFATIVLGFKTIGYKIKNLFRPKPKQAVDKIDSSNGDKS
jgi:hypothetical protein